MFFIFYYILRPGALPSRHTIHEPRLVYVHTNGGPVREGHLGDAIGPRHHPHRRCPGVCPSQHNGVTRRWGVSHLQLNRVTGPRLPSLTISLSDSLTKVRKHKKGEKKERD